jgi:hypothetical protein
MELMLLLGIDAPRRKQQSPDFTSDPKRVTVSICKIEDFIDNAQLEVDWVW